MYEVILSLGCLLSVSVIKPISSILPFSIDENKLAIIFRQVLVKCKLLPEKSLVTERKAREQRHSLLICVRQKGSLHTLRLTTNLA